MMSGAASGDIQQGRRNVQATDDGDMDGQRNVTMVAGAAAIINQEDGFLSQSQDGSSNPESSSGTDSSLNILARNMFQKTADYLQGELLLIKEDYKLLENLNLATAAKYADMRQVSGNVITNLQELNQKFEGLAPILKQIDQIEDSVAKLEQAAYKLDNYSKRLEAKFKMLEQRH